MLEKEAAVCYERNEACQGYRNLSTTSSESRSVPRLKGVSFERAIISAVGVARSYPLPYP